MSKFRNINVFQKNCFGFADNSSPLLTLKQTIFQPTTACEQFFYEKGNPREKDNGPSLKAELQYSVKIEIQKRPVLFWNRQSFVDCSMERSIRYDFFIDLESIQHKLSSDYSLNIYFSRCFAYIDGPLFSPYKPLKYVDFSKVDNMQFSFSGIVLTY